MSTNLSTDQWRELLSRSPLAQSAPPAAVDRGSTYLHFLYAWAEKMNLTSISDPEEAVERHFWEAAPALPFLVPGRAIDIGSGAGFPGLPIKIMRPELEITLLEPRQKRAVFLREAIEACGLTGIEVLANRLEDIDSKEFKYSNFLWRAIKVSLDDLEPLVQRAPTARCVAWTTVEAGRDIEATGPNHWDTLHWVRMRSSKDRVIFVSDHILRAKAGASI